MAKPEKEDGGKVAPDAKSSSEEEAVKKEHTEDSDHVKTKPPNRNLAILVFYV